MDGRKEGREEEGVVNGGILIGMRGAARYSSAMATFCDITSSRIVLSLSLSLKLNKRASFSAASVLRFPSEYWARSVYTVALLSLGSAEFEWDCGREEGRGKRREEGRRNGIGVGCQTHFTWPSSPSRVARQKLPRRRRGTMHGWERDTTNAKVKAEVPNERRAEMKPTTARNISCNNFPLRLKFEFGDRRRGAVRCGSRSFLYGWSRRCDDAHRGNFSGELRETTRKGEGS